MEENVESVKIMEVAEPIEETTEEVVEQVEQNEDEIDKEQNEDEIDKEQNDEENENEDDKQSKEDNSIARLVRIKAEKEYKEKLSKVETQAYEKGLKEAENKLYIGKINPYTNEIVKDEFDVKEYIEMLEIDEKGGEPLKDYSIKLKEKARNEAKEQIKKEEELKQQDNSKEDINNFIKSYPNVDLKEMFKNPKFSKFINGKIGNQPLIEIYEDYQELIGDFEKEAQTKAKKIIANTKASPGSLKSGQSDEIDFDKMSDEDFERYEKKIARGELKFKR